MWGASQGRNIFFTNVTYKGNHGNIDKILKGTNYNRTEILQIPHEISSLYNIRCNCLE